MASDSKNVVTRRFFPSLFGALRWETLWHRIRRNWQLYILLLLPLIWLLVFRYAPMYGAQIAFRKYTPVLGIEGSPWVGFDNFTRFFNSPKFQPVVSERYYHRSLGRVHRVLLFSRARALCSHRWTELCARN